MTEEHSAIVDLLLLGRFMFIQRGVEHSQEQWDRYIIQDSSLSDSVQACLINLLKISPDHLSRQDKYVRGRPDLASPYCSIKYRFR